MHYDIGFTPENEQFFRVPCQTLSLFSSTGAASHDWLPPPKLYKTLGPLIIYVISCQSLATNTYQSLELKIMSVFLFLDGRKDVNDGEPSSPSCSGRCFCHWLPKLHINTKDNMRPGLEIVFIKGHGLVQPQQQLQQQWGKSWFHSCYSEWNNCCCLNTLCLPTLLRGITTLRLNVRVFVSNTDLCQREDERTNNPPVSGRLTNSRTWKLFTLQFTTSGLSSGTGVCRRPSVLIGESVIGWTSRPIAVTHTHTQTLTHARTRTH